MPPAQKAENLRPSLDMAFSVFSDSEAGAWAVEHHVQFLNHNLPIKRLGDVVGHASLQGFVHEFFFCMNGDHDHGDFLGFCRLPNPLEQFQPAHFLHVPIGDDQIKGIFFQKLPSLLAIFSFNNIFKMGMRQNVPQKQPCGFTVINNQNLNIGADWHGF